MADASPPKPAAASLHPSKSPPATASREASGSAPRVRRRNRVIASCLECRRRKLKCDKLAPCTNCTKLKRDCLYLSPALDSASQQRLADIKDRMGNLEQSLERDVARRTSSTDKNVARAAKSEDVSDDDEDDSNVPEDERNLEPTPLASLDAVYEDDVDDDLIDLGVQLGKMRFSDRIGGFARPKFAEEFRIKVNNIGASPPPQPVYDSYSNSQQWLQADTSLPSYLGPSPEYIAPASSFFFPAPQTRSSLRDYLPTRSVCDVLMAQYWRAVHTITAVVHKPSFQRQYDVFWTHIAQGTEPPNSLQAVVFAAIFAAAVSSPEQFVQQQFGVPRSSLIERFQSIVETSLSKANFLRTAKLETMQALVIYLIPLCRAEVSRSHSALCGTAIRLAECMGLHRDGSHYGFSVVETHVRRLVWYQLCFLDIRTCEATGPRPQIRSSEFDTEFPMNVNESDLTKNPPHTEDLKEFTDMTLSRMRFECSEMHRSMWADIRRLDTKQVRLSTLMNKSQKWRNEMDAKYLPLLKGRDPRQIVALHIYQILTRRLTIMYLHRYYTSPKSPMPDRLRNLLIDACLSTIEYGISLESRAETAPWHWYRGALMQYHAALLLLMAVTQTPNMHEAARIWKCIDFVYELPPHLTADQKAESIYVAIKDRLEAFTSMRKAKVSKNVQQQLDIIRGTQPPAVEIDFSGPTFNGWGAGAAPAMDAQQFANPPLQVNLSSENSGSQPPQAPVSGGSSDLLMQELDDIDWNEWDKVFPSHDSSLTTGMDFASIDFSNVDFDMGSYTSFAPSRSQSQSQGQSQSQSPAVVPPAVPHTEPQQGQDPGHPGAGVIPRYHIDFGSMMYPQQ